MQFNEMRERLMKAFARSKPAEDCGCNGAMSKPNEFTLATHNIPFLANGLENTSSIFHKMA